MKIEDCEVGMKVKLPVGKSSKFDLWDLSRITPEGQDFAYICAYSLPDNIVVLGEHPNHFRFMVYAKDIEPYEEKKMDKLERIEQIERELAELKKQVEEESKPKKDWPDSFQEAMKISKYWGMDVNGQKFMIIPSMGGFSEHLRNINNAHLVGRALNIFFCTLKTHAEDMTPYWEGKKQNTQFFKFNSGKELFRWMSED